jgi:PAS domain S-box-containing protein
MLPPATEGRAPGASQPSRVLVIEDNRDLAENIAEALADEGYVPRVTTSAREALEAAREGFDLAFLDVRLPDADGTRTLVSLKACDALAEVIVMSGDATIESAIATVRGGAFAYILKPFPIDEALRLAALAMRQVALRREREALLQQLQESEAHYRTVVEASPALIVGVSSDGRVALVNGAFERTSGYARETFIGRPFAEIVPVVHDGPWAPAASEELPLQTADGSERYIAWHYGHADGLRYAIGIDLTEGRAMERRIRVAEQLAVVGELTAGLAHEIRNPLNSALLELKVLTRRLTRATDTAGVASADVIRGELERLERLLAEFLWFARPRSMTEATLGDVTSPIRTVARLIQAEAATRNITLQVDIADDLPPVVFVEDRVRQVVFNLVRNAIDAIEHDGQITLRARHLGEHVELQVEDNGKGIEGDPKRVFMPFHTTKPTGTGLGLTIAQRIVADHGGELLVESEPGRTVFTLRLPAAPNP